MNSYKVGCDRGYGISDGIDRNGIYRKSIELIKICNDADYEVENDINIIAKSDPYVGYITSIIYPE